MVSRRLATPRRPRRRLLGLAVTVGLVMAIILLLVEVMTISASRKELRAECDALEAYLDAVAIERDAWRNAYDSITASFNRSRSEYWYLEGMPPTYLIYLDGGTCSAENVVNGEVEFRDPDAATVIQSAIAALPTGGGKILLRPGTYLLSTSLRDGGRDFVLLQGEGWNTTLKISDNVSRTVIDLSGRTGWAILDLAIDGNKAHNAQRPGGVPMDMNQNGIRFFQVTHSKILRCYIHDTVMHGINIHYQSTDNLVADCRVEGCGTPGDYGASAGILVFSNSSRNEVRRCRCIDNFARGIYVSARSNNCTISENLITGGRTEAAQGIIVMDGCQGVGLHNNTIHDVPGNGIDVGNRYGPAYAEITIRGNTITKTGSSGIWCGSGGVDVTITDNHVAKAGSYAISALGARSRIVNNCIYATEDLAILSEGPDSDVSGNSIYPP